MYMIVLAIAMFIAMIVLVTLWYRTVKLTAWKRQMSKEILENLDESRINEITKMMWRQNISGSTLDFCNSWLGYNGNTFRLGHHTRNKEYVYVTPWKDWGMLALIEIALSWQPETLDLSHGNFGDNAVESLVKALRKMPKLKTLKLNNNRIRDKGASKLAKALKNTNLEELYIFANDFLNLYQTGYEDLTTAWGDSEGLHLRYEE
jgi:hypothetical protein